MAPTTDAEDPENDVLVAKAEAPVADAPEPEMEAPERRRIRIQLLVETAYALDRSFWIGPKLSVCRLLGAICLGMEIRYAGDTTLTGDTDETKANRILLDGLIIAHLPLEWDRVAVCPGIALGAGYYATWKGRPLGQHGGFRAEAYVSLAVRATRWLYVEVLGLSFGLSLPVHTDVTDGTSSDRVTLHEPRGFIRGGIGIRYQLP